MFYCASNAGKFTSYGAVTVDVTTKNRARRAPIVTGSLKGSLSSLSRVRSETSVVDEVTFLVITVSNTRCGAAIEDPEAMFIPFKGTYEGMRPTSAGG